MMEHLDTNLIDRVLKGNSTLEEARKVIKWMRTKAGQRYLTNHIDKYFGKQIKDVEVPSATMKGRLFRALLWRDAIHKKWIYAAAIFCIIISGITLYINCYLPTWNTIQWKEVYVPNGKRMHLLLSDGTSVYLGPDSRLKYPDRFPSDHRKIVLSGEGYFDVFSNKQCPFYVDLGILKIKVTGTSFSVMARRIHSDIKLKLDKGHVNILYKKQSIPVKPGEYMVYNKITHHFSVGKEEAGNYVDWKANIYRFDNAPLPDILEALTQKYNIRFFIRDPKVKTYNYTLTLSDTPLQQVLSNMEISAPIHFTQKGNVYHVTLK